MIYILKRPFFLNHKINIACDCRCKICNSWKKKEDKSILLTRDEIEALLENASRAGMLSYSIWGGEPLLREDTSSVLAYAKKLGFFTTVSTNASLLEERAEELAPHTSLFTVSLDGMRETHDHIRGFPGLFEKVVRGIEEVRIKGGKIRLFYMVNADNIKDIEQTAGLAKELGVSISFYPLLNFPGYNDSLCLSPEQTRETFDNILKLKREGYPVVNLSSYLKVIRDDKKVKCHFPKYHIYVDWEGTLYTCDLAPDNKHIKWGDIRDVDLFELISGQELRKQAKELENCNQCRLSCAELGYGSPFVQFPERILSRVRHELLFQK